MAKIAIAARDRGIPPQARRIARGDGWTVSEVVCTLGPEDRVFEERHSSAAIAIVAAGTFQYRSSPGGGLMTPGSLLLGSSGQHFECCHQHGRGDRCISFSYSPEFFERIEAEPVFRELRMPPLRFLSPLIARAQAALAGAVQGSWEELAVELAAQTVHLDRGLSRKRDDVGAGATAEVTRLVRRMESDPGEPHDLTALAREVRLSPYHLLRTFRSVTGVTPHQYLLRLRLQGAAVRLRIETTKVVDIALECGFGDVSNFNRSLHAEFGVCPRAWRHSSIVCRRPL